MEFFETKVIKVKKEKKRCGHQPAMVILGDKYAKFKCIKCGEIYSSDISSTLWGKRKKGNWVNGENLDKIMFPCFCSWVMEKKKYYGEINKSYNSNAQKDIYLLSDITRQVNGKDFGQHFSVIYDSDSLERLIKNQDIHILKGKIIIFETEKESK